MNVNTGRPTRVGGTARGQRESIDQRHFVGLALKDAFPTPKSGSFADLLVAIDTAKVQRG